MKYEIDIDYSPERMVLSRRRMEARLQFKYIDRVPINYCVVPRFFAPLFQVPYMDLFTDADTQYRWQLEFAKYHIENISDDFCTEPAISVFPYFDNVIPPSGHGGEVGWVPDGPPRAIPVIKTVEQMEAFQVADPETGLRGKAIRWWNRMAELIDETKITFNGEPGKVNLGILALGGLSPHMIAIDLVGEDFYWWMIEYPEQCHRFLEKITQAEIISEDHCRKIDPRKRGGYGLAEDSAQIMSEGMFKQFCVPYANRLFERYGAGLRVGRGVHMCGDSTHLHRSLKEDLRIDSFDIFGYQVPPKTAAENMGGTTLLWGNINPMLMKDGPDTDVYRSAKECVEEIGPCGGFMLGDGANVCPGTPISSFDAVMAAACDYGLGDGELPVLDE